MFRALMGFTCRVMEGAVGALLLSGSLVVEWAFYCEVGVLLLSGCLDVKWA